MSTLAPRFLNPLYPAPIRFIDVNWLSAELTGTHIPSDGSDIGGADPVVWEVNPLPGDNVELLISGCKTPGGYGSGECFWQRPLPPGIAPVTYLLMEWSPTYNGAAMSNLQASETDCILILPGIGGGVPTPAKPNPSWHLDGSTQLNVAAGGQEQITMSEAWVNVAGAKQPGLLTPNVEHQCASLYKITLPTIAVPTPAMQYVGIAIDGIYYVVGQKCDVSPSNWDLFNYAGGATVQAQLDQTPAALGATVLYSKGRLTWMW